VHAIDKNEKKKYNCEKILSKRPRKMICAFLVPKPCHEVDPSAPTKDVFTLKYTIEVAKTFIVVAKTIMLSSIDGCNQNWTTLFTFHLHFQ